MMRSDTMIQQLPDRGYSERLRRLFLEFGVRRWTLGVGRSAEGRWFLDVF